ncbi:AIPR family protein [Salinibacterium sp. NG253]|uniref:AIPR family protein n=1 Tax=Salinibacterium sp. NG253 TaxID=2792039 RepID=UPI0018CDFF9A|nr:AIPR family protein [Salinibacterium sp. NG253]MBH0116672.1 AIPR family protein [Salinibacterium sp. NG253]
MEQSLPTSMSQGELFEHFVNYCLISEKFDEEFDIHDTHTGGGNDLSIDGLAIVVNGVIVTSVEAAKELLTTNGFLDVEFIFIQSKSGEGFSGEQMVSLKDGVVEFFAEELSLPASPKIIDYRAIMSWIFDQSGQFKRGKPRCELIFATAGSWQDDPQLLVKIAKIRAEILGTNLFEQVSFTPLGAAELQSSWKHSKDSVKAEFTFTKKATLADIEGVKESYLGVLPLAEFLKVIEDEGSGVRKNIFVDNVRDFQGDNPVNGEMSQSLATEEGRNRFAVLNNGVTLVARQLHIVGDKFYAADYQIVNGCQTSHVIYNNKDLLEPDMQIPFKVIATDDEEVIGAIATATNRQTLVTEEDLYALEEIQKKLEAYFQAFEDKHKLYYERRSKQYSSAVGIEKVRIITKQIEIRSFGAMFLNEGHRATRYYAALKSMVGSAIFNVDHKLEPYYAAAFAYYKLEFLFRNGQIPVAYKPARYHLLMAFRHIVAGTTMPLLSANKIEAYARKITDTLWDDTKTLKAFQAACSAIDEALGGSVLDGDAVKVQAFTDKVLLAAKSPK